ncbi:MAG TPA: Ku protein [Streptosporangiaceae bacterium]|jgi:DNA end-binding protein Ku
MRSIWKGAISFGLVTIPVKLYSATEQKDVAFHQVHRKDGGRIKFRRVCTVDGEEVPYSDVAKGYELPGGEVVVLTDEDFADLPLSTSRRIDVLQFSDADQVDPIYFNKSYYLEPDTNGDKPYVLLRNALESSGRVAVVKVALRQRESLATLRVRDGVFVLETMLWPDEVRTPEFPFLDEDVDVRSQELTMATSLIETMTGDFDPSDYKDAYREALQAVIEAKAEGREVVQPEPTAEEPAAADLLSALRASVEAAKKSRGADDDKGDDKGDEKSESKPKRSSTSKKTESKKTTTKKAPAKSRKTA